MKGLSFGLFDLLLLIGVAAVLIGYNSANVRRQSMMSEIHEMKITAGELVVADKRKLQAKTNKSDFGNVKRRDFHVPKGARYELRVAHAEANAPEVVDFVRLSAGTHWIDVMYRQDKDGMLRYVVKLDGRDFHEKISTLSWADLAKFSYDQELGDEDKIVLLQEPELLLWVEQVGAKAD